MVTLHLNAEFDAEAVVQKAGELLRDGELVAIPTETVYGLAACISNVDALAKVFRVKQRPADNPLIVHVAHRRDVHNLADVNETAAALMDAFWPGALTLVLPKKETVNDLVTAGLDTVAVRMPSLQITRDIIVAAGEPLAAPSANISGRPSSTTAQHVLDDFAGSIAAVVDAGACEQGIESTVVRVTMNGARCRVQVLRPGVISRANIEAVVGQGIVDACVSNEALAASPGTRHRHYAPRARVVLCFSEAELRANVLTITHSDTQQEALQGSLQGSLHSALVLSITQPDLDVAWRPLSASTLFAELRRADDLHVNKILVHCTDAVMLDEALMNRLRKAAEPFGESGVDK